MAESEETLKNLLMKVKEENEKVALKLRSWHLVPSLHGKLMRKKWKWWQVLFSRGSKITVDGNCSHEIKRYLLLGRKIMAILDNILKSRDITLITNIYIVKAIVFPVVLYRCDRVFGP